MTEYELQQKNAMQLLKLIQENPLLRIVPMVDTDVCASDDFGSWAGSFGKPRLDEVWNDDERIYFRSDDIDTLTEKRFDEIEDDYKGVDDEIIYETAHDEVINYQWEKVITVKIGLPL